MLTKFYLVRHGKCEHNLGTEKEHTFAGSRINSGLNAEGIENARNIADKILVIGGTTLILHSSLKRSTETAEIVKNVIKDATDNNTPMHLINGMEEVDIGDFAGYTEDEVKELFPESAEAFYSGDIEEWDFPNGEKYAQILSRVKHILEQFADLKKDRVTICGHSMLNRVLLHELFKNQPDLWKPRSYPHEKIFIFNLIGGKVRVI